MTRATEERAALGGVRTEASPSPRAEAQAGSPPDPGRTRGFRVPVPLWITLAGWYGVAALLGAYFLTTHGYIEQDGLYLFLNASGAFGIALLAWKKHAWQAVVLELVWAVISLSALWRLIV